MARRTLREPLAVPGGRAPSETSHFAVIAQTTGLWWICSFRAGGVRVSKKQEAIPAGRNTGPKGRDKTSVVSISKMHHVDVMLRKWNNREDAISFTASRQSCRS
ncbi:death-associated protein-like 1 isoform X3 [Tympanuchus pallidicinctus]|uniref:death-associated protein-like 1 isoform X3 n=1 Tax=Tympanuchus pallidicinctus TaxID=109042 RepID=UPI002286E417|nr:death-associated protein-like 1 isoform X3 [Tympanuchus pallidicinctus]